MHASPFFVSTATSYHSLFIKFHPIASSHTRILQCLEKNKMETKGFDLCFIMCTVIAYCHGAAAQSSCTSALISLSPCLNYITGNYSTPSSSCCSQLAGVVQSQPQCLCSVLNGDGTSLGINVNQTLALALPGACKVQTPPMSQCNAANGPSTTTPATSPMSPPADTPDASPRNDPSGNGSKSTEDGNAANGSTKEAPTSLGIYIVLMAWSFVLRV